MSRILPLTPAMDSICREKGSDYLFSTYFVDQFETTTDAPNGIKREAAALREFYEKNGLWHHA